LNIEGKGGAVNRKQRIFFENADFNENLNKLGFHHSVSYCLFSGLIRKFYSCKKGAGFSQIFICSFFEKFF